jgi:hypothetical protein
MGNYMTKTSPNISKNEIDLRNSLTSMQILKEEVEKENLQLREELTNASVESSHNISALRSTILMLESELQEFKSGELKSLELEEEKVESQKEVYNNCQEEGSNINTLMSGEDIERKIRKLQSSTFKANMEKEESQVEAEAPIVESHPAESEEPIVESQPADSEEPIVESQPEPEEPIVESHPADSEEPIVESHPADSEEPIVESHPEPEEPIVESHPAESEQEEDICDDLKEARKLAELALRNNKEQLDKLKENESEIIIKRQSALFEQDLEEDEKN